MCPLILLANILFTEIQRNCGLPNFSKRLLISFENINFIINLNNVLLTLSNLGSFSMKEMLQIY